MLHLRGRSAVAAALVAEPRRRRSLLAQARADARRLERERVGYADGLAALVRAGVASLSDGRSPALASLRRAAAALDAAAMPLHAAAARRSEGLLLGGDAGAERIRAADAAFAAENVRNPARMTAMWIPGRFEPTA
jgi:eukaryotic-like serine/threonine-protein kinase